MQKYKRDSISLSPELSEMLSTEAKRTGNRSFVVRSALRLFSRCRVWFNDDWQNPDWTERIGEAAECLRLFGSLEAAQRAYRLAAATRAFLSGQITEDELRKTVVEGKEKQSTTPG